jgi:transcriptional regulator with XRE-family HTH domain
MTDPELAPLQLAERLRRLRTSRGLEPADLAARAGLPREEVEAIESGRSEPAIGQLIKLANVLGVSVGHFFFQGGEPRRRIEVVRAQQRWPVQPHTEAGRALNYRYQALSYHLTEKLMAPFLIEIPPDDGASVTWSSHEGEEFLFVLSGQLRVTIAGEEQQLGPGDSIYFDSRLEHALRAVEGAPVRMVACVAQPPGHAGDDALGRAHDHDAGPRRR